MANRAKGSRSRNSGYQSVQPTRVPRSAFDLSYGHKTTADPSVLMPLYHQEVLPGDTLSVRPSFLARMTSNVFPYMDGISLEYQFFFCPARILWTNWSKMHGEQENPGDHTSYTVPQMTAPSLPEQEGYGINSMSDYLGLPTEVEGITHSAMYHRACATIWNEWYRDQNLQDSLDVPIDDGPDDWDDPAYVLQKRGKRKDRFAGALPFAQKGTPVELPLGTTAPVVSDGTGWQVYTDTDTAARTALSLPSAGIQFGPSWTGVDAIKHFNSGLEADLTSATAATINEIRMAVSLQHMFERDARGGTRYAEMVYSHFGVRMPDIRYRPEILAVGSVAVTPHEVPQQSETLTGTPQGTLAAYAKGIGVGPGFTKSFDEFGYVIGFVSIRSEVAYSQGIPAAFLRKTRVDHYVPDLALMGEEAILSQEIFADGSGDPDLMTGDYSIWGYTPRYESYRHRVNQISGEFRSNIAGDQLRLDQWHFGLDFSTRPVLNDAFIEDDPDPILRNLAAELSPPFLVDCFWKSTCVRPMPKFANPGLVRF